MKNEWKVVSVESLGNLTRKERSEIKYFAPDALSNNYKGNQMFTISDMNDLHALLCDLHGHAKINYNLEMANVIKEVIDYVKVESERIDDRNHYMTNEILTRVFDGVDQSEMNDEKLMDMINKMDENDMNMLMKLKHGDCNI